MAESLMTVEELADYLSVPVKTVYRWRLTGAGPRGAKVGRYIRFRRADVDSWLDRQLQEERATGVKIGQGERRDSPIGCQDGEIFALPLVACRGNQPLSVVQPCQKSIPHSIRFAVLRDAGFVLESPKAAMYLWVALPEGVPSAPFARRALEETGAVVLPGSSFGPAGEGYFRIALTVGADRLREAAGRLGRVLQASRSGELATTP